MVEVTILSKQIVKPPQPPSNPHGSVALSLLDQLAPPIYTHVLLFYSKYSPDTLENLKASLSQTLKHFYPLAGRMRETGNGKLHIECNDEGVEFIEAWIVGATTKSIREDPTVELMKELFPIKRNMFDCRENGPLLAVQTTLLDDGEFVLGVSICHSIADGSSLSMFLRWWSHVARDRGFPENRSPAPLPPHFACASVFLPQDITQRTLHKNIGEEMHDVAKRCFSINSEAMARLKQVSGCQPTRVEAVSALVWRSIQRTHSECNKLCMALVVNLHKRLLPTMPHELFGNLYFPVEITMPETDDATSKIEENIRRAVDGVKEQLSQMRQLNISDTLRAREMEHKEKGIESVDWAFSSWCGMGWYKCDFGIGDQPVWAAGEVTATTNLCILIDAKDGHGMDVWLWTAREKMDKISADPEFRRFVCSP